ncbi:MAG: hypothetical protein N3H31_04865 [Candidatus Nezhaarchaeota archaeon]|nr:hypothetical protein [Candidatus Nezhaarchaeota archaeon]
MEGWLSRVRELVEGQRGFEVKVEGGEVKVVESEVGGKAKLPAKELRRYVSKKRLCKELKALLIDAAERLGSLKVPFKVTLGAGEFIVRFDLERYVRVHREGSSIVGFKDLSERPLDSIAELLRRHGEVRILTPVR